MTHAEDPGLVSGGPRACERGPGLVSGRPRMGAEAPTVPARVKVAATAGTTVSPGSAGGGGEGGGEGLIFAKQGPVIGSE